jgi:hypothetical protein
MSDYFCIVCNKKFIPSIDNGRQKTCLGKACQRRIKIIRNQRFNKNHKKDLIPYQREYARNYHRKNPIKSRIRAKSRHYMEKNNIPYIGDCEDCGAFTKRQIHHISYVVTDFVLLCFSCHQKRHGKEVLI